MHTFSDLQIIDIVYNVTIEVIRVIGKVFNGKLAMKLKTR